MDTNYDPQKIEAKWRKLWAEQKLFDADVDPDTQIDTPARLTGLLRQSARCARQESQEED